RSFRQRIILIQGYQVGYKVPGVFSWNNFPTGVGCVTSGQLECFVGSLTFNFALFVQVAERGHHGPWKMHRWFIQMTMQPLDIVDSCTKIRKVWPNALGAQEVGSLPQIVPGDAGSDAPTAKNVRFGDMRLANLL